LESGYSIVSFISRMVCDKDKAFTEVAISLCMSLYSRRSLLRTATVSLGVLAAGCTTASNDDTPSQETVAATPPGSPALDPSGEWASDRFDAGNTGANPAGTGVQNGATYWRLDAGGSAAFANGLLYNQTNRGIAYRDPTTAAMDTRSEGPAPQINGPPVVTTERVFATNADGVYCFDAQSGERQWLHSSLDGKGGYPTVHEGIVVLGNQPLRAFDVVSGKQLWQYDIESASHTRAAVGNGQAFISSDSGLHALDLKSGEESFTITGEMDGTFFVGDGAYSTFTPVVTNGLVYGRNSTYDLVAADTSDGSIHWRVPMASTGFRYADTPPVVTDDVVYATTEHGIAAFDSMDGTVITSSETSARPVGLVGTVLYTVRGGTVAALDTENNLDQLWSVTTGADCQEDVCTSARIYQVTPANEAVYVSALDGFYGIGPKKQD